MKNKSKETLQILLQWSENITNEGAKDNIISALMKLVTFNFDSVPYKSLVNTLYSHLPLQDDVDENEKVAK